VSSIFTPSSQISFESVLAWLLRARQYCVLCMSAIRVLFASAQRLSIINYSIAMSSLIPLTSTPREGGISRFFTFINHYPSTPKALSTNSPRLATKRTHMIFLGAAPVFQLLLKDRGPDLGRERSVFENSELVPI